jgi:hypothetical protein
MNKAELDSVVRARYVRGPIYSRTSYWHLYSEYAGWSDFYFNVMPLSNRIARETRPRAFRPSGLSEVPGHCNLKTEQNPRWTI